MTTCIEVSRICGVVKLAETLRDTVLGPRNNLLSN